MKVLTSIVELFFPTICYCCDSQLTEGEKHICLNCRFDLPTTNFTKLEGNIVEQAFYGRIPIVAATALFYFYKEGKIQKLIHQLKYRGEQNVGVFTGKWLGQELKDSARFNTIDCVIPVPLHKKKLKKRGYNQVEKFGKTLATILNVDYIDNVLVKVTATKTQTHKIRFDRWKNVSELFTIQNSQLIANKHILLIDDVITTGATLEACYKALNKANNINISIASIAYTK
ncbi:MAG TPA: phosphoribosyltransferase family protein [Flavobacteriaceae bacterium]|nr:phosphoribosyltransferase family protein [Flavobacteriaceae bacterium]